MHDDRLWRTQRFCRKHRLTRPAEFKRVYAGARVADGNLRVAAVQNSLGIARLGIVVSRRAVGRAVVRNRLKRCVREAFRRCRMLLTGLDVVVSVERQAAALSNREFVSALQRLLAKVGHAQAAQ